MFPLCLLPFLFFACATSTPLPSTESVVWLEPRNLTVSELDGFATVTVHRGGDTTGTVSLEVFLATLNGTGTIPEDAADLNGTAVRFAAGEVSHTVVVPVSWDEDPLEGTEEVSVVIAGAAAVSPPAAPVLVAADPYNTTRVAIEDSPGFPPPTHLDSGARFGDGRDGVATSVVPNPVHPLPPSFMPGANGTGLSEAGEFRPDGSLTPLGVSSVAAGAGLVKFPEPDLPATSHFLSLLSEGDEVMLWDASGTGAYEFRRLSRVQRAKGVVEMHRGSALVGDALLQRPDLFPPADAAAASAARSEARTSLGLSGDAAPGWLMVRVWNYESIDIAGSDAVPALRPPGVCRYGIHNESRTAAERGALASDGYLLEGVLGQMHERTPGAAGYYDDPPAGDPGDCTRGGIYVARARTSAVVRAGATVDASGAGAPGGEGHVGQINADGWRGVGFCGGPYSSADGKTGRTETQACGGGGGGELKPGDWGTGGGGGGHASAGSPGEMTQGSFDYVGDGGAVYGTSNLLAALHVGSGGGGGATDDDPGAVQAGGNGGRGGGVVMLFAPEVTVDGTVSVAGHDGARPVANSGQEAGGGGGGSGGSLLVVGDAVTMSGGVLDARGGVGGADYNPSYVVGGGNGGVGWIQVSCDTFNGADCTGVSPGTVSTFGSVDVQGRPKTHHDSLVPWGDTREPRFAPYAVFRMEERYVAVHEFDNPGSHPTVNLTVSREGSDDSLFETVDVLLVDGTAEGLGIDYGAVVPTVNANGTRARLEFPPGVYRQSLMVPIVNDGYRPFEPLRAEDFSAHLENVTSPAASTLIADDPWATTAVDILNIDYPYARLSPYPRFRFNNEGLGRGGGACPSGTGPAAVSERPPQWGVNLTSATGPDTGAAILMRNGNVLINNGAGNALLCFDPHGALVWSFHAGADVARSPAVDGDGDVVYVGSDDSNMHALNASTGQLLWTFANATGPIRGSPTIAADGTVYVGSMDNHLYAVHPNGTLRWRFGPTTDGFHSPATVGHDGTLYVACRDTNLYALFPNGTEKWVLTTPSGVAVDSAPIIGHDGSVIAGFHGGSGVVAASSEDGSARWTFPVTGNVKSSPALSGDGTMLFFGVEGGVGRGVYAVHAASGAQLWFNAAVGDTHSSPTLSEDGLTLYIGAADANVYALDTSTGAPRWTFATGGAVHSSPALACDGAVYVGAEDARLYRIVPYTLFWIEEREVSAGLLRGPDIVLTVRRGAADVSAPSSVLLRVDGPRTTGRDPVCDSRPQRIDFPIGVDSVKARVPLGTGVEALLTPHSLVASLHDPEHGQPSDYASGAFLATSPYNESKVTIEVTASSYSRAASWPRLNLDNTGSASLNRDAALALPNYARELSGSMSLNGAIVDHDGNVYIAVRSPTVLTSYDERGDTRWTAALGSTTYRSLALATDSMGSLLVLIATANVLRAIDASSGNVEWSITTLTMVSSPVVDDRGLVYIGTYADVVNAHFIDNGTIAWSTTVVGADVRSTACVDANRTVTFGTDGPDVRRVGPDGTDLWTENFAGSGNVRSGAALGVTGRVYVGTLESKILALDGATGAELWSAVWATSPSDDIYMAPVLSYGEDGMERVHVAAGSVLHAWNGDDGSVLWGGPIALPGTGGHAALVLWHRFILAGGTDSLSCFDAATGVLQWDVALGGGSFAGTSIALAGRGDAIAVYVTTTGPDAIHRVAVSPVVYLKERSVVVSEHELEVNITVHRDGAVGNHSFSVDVVLEPLTATGAGVDFNDTTVTLVFSGSDTARSAVIAIAWEPPALSLPEGNETFAVSLRNVVQTSGDHRVLIADSPWNRTDVTILDTRSPYANSTWPRGPRDSQKRGNAGDALLHLNGQGAAVLRVPPWVALAQESNMNQPVIQAGITPSGNIVVPEFAAGNITSFDAHGNRRWEVDVAGSTGCNRGPAIDFEGTAYVSCREEMIAVREDGSVKWQVTHNGTFCDHGVALTDGDAFAVVGCANGRLKWFDTAVGNESMTTNFAAADVMKSSGVAIASDGSVFVPAVDGKLYKADGDTGAKVWEVTIGDVRHSSPLLMFDGSVVIVTYFTRVLHRISPAGDEMWTLTVGASGEVLDSPLLSTDEKTLFVATRGGTIHAVDAGTGTELWSQAFCCGSESGAVMSHDERSIFFGHDNAVTSLDAATGAVLWTFPTGGDVRSLLSLAGDGSIYAPADDGKVYHIVPYALVWIETRAVSLVEGGQFNVTVMRDGMDTSVAFDVDIVFVDGTATGGGVDYDPGSSATKTISFASGDTAPKDVTVAVPQDLVTPEANETFTVSLQNIVLTSPGTNGVPHIADASYSSMQVVIIDDPPVSSLPRMPPPPAVSLAPFAVSASATVSWSAPSIVTAGMLPVTAFHVFRDGVRIGTTGSGTLAFTDPGPLAENTAYAYTLSINNTLGEGPASAATVATTMWRAPSLSSVAPAFGPLVGGTPLVLSGSFLRNVTLVTIGGFTATIVSRTGAPASVAVLTPPRAAAGSVPVVVTSSLGGLSSNAATFLYLAPPVVNGSFPGISGRLEQVQVVVVGSGFGTSAPGPGVNPGAISVTLASHAVPCSPVTWLNDSALRCTAGISAIAGDGPVTVTTVGGGPGSGGVFAFTAPSITSVDPPTVPVPTFGTVVTLHGSLLGRGDAVDFASANVSLPAGAKSVSCAPAVLVSSAEVHCTLPDLEAGDAAITVETLSGGTSPAATLTVSPAPTASPAPTPPNVTASSPRSGPVAGGTVITVEGHALGSSAADLTAIHAAGVPCSTSLWISPTRVECVTGPTPGGDAVAGPLRVTTMSGGTSPVDAHVSAMATFAYVKLGLSPPAITALSPAASPLQGGVGVRILGISLASDAADVSAVMIAGVPCADVAFVSTGELFCTAAASATVVTGPVTLTSGLAGGALSGPDFAYFDETVVAPVVTAVDPPRGPVEGGITVTVHGQSFGVAGAAPDPVNQVAFDALPASTVQLLSSSSLRCVVPPLPAGDRSPRLARVVVSSAAVSSSSSSTALAAAAGGDYDPASFAYVRPMALQSIEPGLLVLATGGSLSLSGAFWEDVVEVRVEEISLGMFNTTHAGTSPVPVSRGRDRSLHPLQAGGAGTRSAHAVQPLFDGTDQDSVVVEVGPTALRDSGGYHRVTVLNPIRGTASSLDDVLFATDDCPEEGQYGTGKDCKDCPEGGVCPGGNRIWPEAGYWNPGEDSGFVARCPRPVSRCLGRAGGGNGTTAACATGYVGSTCSLCADGYTLASATGACVICPDKSSLIVFILADVFLWTSVAIIGAFTRSAENFQRVVGIVSVLQTAGMFSTVLSPDLPSWMLWVYNALHIFLGDYSIVRQDCFGNRPRFAISFALQLSYSFAIGAVMLILCMFVGVVRNRALRLKHDDDGGGDGPADSIQARRAGMRKFYRDRAFRVITVWLQLAYVNITRRALEVVNCTPFGGSGRLVVQVAPEVECFKGAHIPLFIAAIALVLVVTIGWPVAYTVRISRETEETVIGHPTFNHRWGTHTILLKHERRYFYVFMYSMMAALACAEVFGSQSPSARSIISIAGVSVLVAALLLMSPHRSRQDDLVMILYTAPILMLLSVSTARDNGQISASAEKWTIVAALSTLTLCFIISVADAVYNLAIRRTVDIDDLARTTHFLATGNIFKPDDHPDELKNVGEGTLSSFTLDSEEEDDASSVADSIIEDSRSTIAGSSVARRDSVFHTIGAAIGLIGEDSDPEGDHHRPSDENRPLPKSESFLEIVASAFGMTTEATYEADKPPTENGVTEENEHTEPSPSTVLTSDEVPVLEHDR